VDVLVLACHESSTLPDWTSGGSGLGELTGAMSFTFSNVFNNHDTENVLLLKVRFT